jgi:hypothetical protein
MSEDIDIISVNNTHQALLRWGSVKRVLEKPVERSIGKNKRGRCCVSSQVTGRDLHKELVGEFEQAGHCSILCRGHMLDI